MKKRIALALAMAICLSLLCTVALADKVTVNFFHRWPNEPKNSYINSLIDEFEAANPDIDIVADCVLNDSYKEKIRVLVSTDALPDVFFSWSGVFGENLTRSGRVLALDDVMARDSEWSSQIVEGQWAPFNYNGKQYGAPWSMDGKAFFYVNPLEVFPEADLKDPNKHHVKIERQKWFACACCPPNIARLLADLGQYIYRKDENGVAVDLFIGSEVKVSGGVTLTQNSQVPFGGKVSFKLSCPNGTKLTLRVRKPFWTDGVICDAEMTEKNGYLVVEKVWNDGDTVSFDFAMPVRRVYASPYVRQDLGKVCLMRGPLVYCLEEADNGNNLHLVSLPEESEIAPAQGEGVLSGMTTLKAKGLRIVPEEGTLYRGAPCRRKEETQLTFIPYFAWANRGVGEMAVWVRE